MPKMKPRTKAPKGEQLTDKLTGELAIYEQVGLPQHALGENTTYRFRGVLLLYQQALNGREPSVGLSKQFLGHLRKQGFSEGAIYVHRAALQGFHQWRGEHLDFAVRKPHRQPKYVEPKLVEKLLTLSKDSPRDHLVIRLMTDAGLRRGEVRNLKVNHVGEKALRFAGKRGRERTVPLTSELKRALQPFCTGKSRADYVVGLKDKAIYMVIKRYGKMAGDPNLKPHDLRHYFCERLQEAGVPLRIIQELAGHESVETTQVYVGVTGDHLEQAIRKMEAATKPNPPETPEVRLRPLRQPGPLKRIVESVEEDVVPASSLLKKPLLRIVESVKEE
jgi:site-specific recombinase XerD